MPVLTVTEVTGRIREQLEGDPVLGALWVRGEVSNLSIAASGHLYFTLKDQTSQLRAVMFRSRAKSLRFPLANGASVVIRGRISLYERDGNVQLYVYELEQDGIGLQQALLRELKLRLEKEGLFSPYRKRALPRFPQRIGIATSLEGAAVRDIVEILRQRWPAAAVVIAPCAVQGEQAPEEIAAAIARLNRYENVDVIIVGRGGGSLEELAAFNTELVVRAVFASDLPVVSAVGHERDETLTDLAADARAATPSAAAALVSPDRRELSRQLSQITGRLRTAIVRRFEVLRLRFEQAVKSRTFIHPWETICGRRAQTVDGLAVRLEYRTRDRLQKTATRLAVLSGRLEALSPLKTLARGYSICRRSVTGRVISDAAEVAAGERVEVLLYRGRLRCKVEGTADGGNAAS
ncbi:MAG TPA: exodeoxyribonuclease VII large subunit [Desulfotomaculum sp.]|nr:exodeoxyribonuclease VII large subunit [Desulfotomaculum sp.]